MNKLAGRGFKMKDLYKDFGGKIKVAGPKNEVQFYARHTSAVGMLPPATAEKVLGFVSLNQI